MSVLWEHVDKIWQASSVAQWCSVCPGRAKNCKHLIWRSAFRFGTRGLNHLTTPSDGAAGVHGSLRGWWVKWGEEMPHLCSMTIKKLQLQEKQWKATCIGCKSSDWPFHCQCHWLASSATCQVHPVVNAGRALFGPLHTTGGIFWHHASY